MSKTISNRHRAVGKAKQRGLGRGFQAPEINSGDSPSAFPHERLFQEETGITSYIERFNGTLRPRGSRLVRKTLSFSKKLENHISTIWYFINHYNSSLPMHSSFPV